MFSRARGCTYGRKSKVACLLTIPRLGITSRPQCTPEFQQGPIRRNTLTYRWITLHHSHAVAAEEEDKNQQDTEPGRTVSRIPSNKPYPTPSIRFLTLDQAQYGLAVESRDIWEREQYIDIANFLPIQSASQSKDERSQWRSYGKNKEDKLFVNKLLKDKGMHSHNWRIALFNLQKHYTPEKTENVEDSDTSDYVPSVFQTAGSDTQELGCSHKIEDVTRRVASRSRNYRSFRLARNISPPSEWSEASLAVYVEALAESQRTQARIPWKRKPRLKGWTNIGDVVAAFDRVFYSTAVQRSLSIKACNTALRFFYDHGMMAEARSLYFRMEDLRMRIPTETFNILLRGSASQRDLHSFTFLLNNMTRRGFKPNEKTWTLFLQMFDSRAVRAVIVRKMAEKNMLDDIGVRRDVAAHMVDYEIVNHLGDGHDHHSFLDHMNNKYGIGWISTCAGNRLLNEMAKRKSTGESLSLLHEMKQVGFKPNDISMNTLLRHCLPLRQHELAIKILAVFKYQYRVHPGPQSYETLLLQAWRSRLLNFATVVWRSACIYAAVSRKARQLVFHSLLCYTPALDERIQSDDTAEPSNSSRSAKFKRFAGRFVVGVDCSKGAGLNKALDTIESKSRRGTSKWAQTILNSSLRIARTCQLKKDLPQLLRQGLAMDRIWAAEGLHKKDDWRDMLQHAIAVDVGVRKGYLSGGQHRRKSP